MAILRALRFGGFPTLNDRWLTAPTEGLDPLVLGGTVGGFGGAVGGDVVIHVSKFGV